VNPVTPATPLKQSLFLVKTLHSKCFGLASLMMARMNIYLDASENSIIPVSKTKSAQRYRLLLPR